MNNYCKYQLEENDHLVQLAAGLKAFCIKRDQNGSEIKLTRFCKSNYNLLYKTVNLAKE